jgi:hypothetical protein
VFVLLVEGRQGLCAQLLLLCTSILEPDLDLAGGHSEADGELAPGRRVGFVRGLELLLEDLRLSTRRTLSVLDLVRAVVVKRRSRGFSERL